MTTEAERARALAAFEAAGAETVDLPVLQQAETLLDLYGEDIRARAYTARDPMVGELMLRPDFTVPVVEMHLARKVGAARYAYSGRVFRMQEPDSDRPSEYDQVGLESFGDDDPAAAEAEIFALFADLVRDKALRIATGDIGVLREAVEGLTTSDARKAALLRHLWRPNRFRKLLDRFSNPVASPVPVSEAPLIGLRAAAEIEARLEAQEADAAETPIPADEAATISAILDVKEKLPQALERLARLVGESASIQRMQARINALRARDVDVAALDFEGSYGRTNMEYYDGFVFGYYAAEAPLPPVVTGGRYDALTRALGRSVPAVGGMLRPALLAALP